MNDHQAQLEALLFYFGEPIALKKAADVLGISESACREAADTLSESLTADERRGLTLLRNADTLQMVTKPETRVIGEKIIQEEFREALTPAALEVLSLIAYLGPVPRATVDFIRGVNSSFTVRSLLLRGLIERDSENDKGGAYRYRASNQFLEHMSLRSAEELPDREKYLSVFRRFMEEGSAEPASAPTA